MHNYVSKAAAESIFLANTYLLKNATSASSIINQQRLKSLSVVNLQRNLSKFCARLFLRYKTSAPSSTKTICLNESVPYAPPVLPLPPKPGGGCVVCYWIIKPDYL